MHLTGGSPARGTEIGCIHHRDAPSVNRNLFAIQGQVLFLTQYHKSMLVTDRVKTIPRFLPAPVGALVVTYFRYVRPFADIANCMQSSKKSSAYMWSTSAGKCWETTRMSKILKACCERLMGVALTIQSYRLVAVAFSREVVHVHRQPEQRFEDFGGENDDADAVEEIDVAAAQSAHGQRLRVNTYAVGVNKISAMTSKSLHLFSQISEEWHEFLGFEPRASQTSSDSSFSPGCKRSRSIPTIVEPQGSQEIQPASKRRQNGRTCTCKSTWTPAGPTDTELEQRATGTLHSTFGLSNFRPLEQLNAVVAILKDEPILSVVLPTGGGKSLLFMLPAAMDPDGCCTIVIVPFVSLIDDLVRRCENIGIDVVEWTSDRQQWATITLVVVERAVRRAGQEGESADFSTFLQFATNLLSSGKLKRIFFDECHTVVTQESFRPVMNQLYVLRVLSIPQIFLTATLPPSMVKVFENSMVLGKVRYIRKPSFKRNISDDVVERPSGGTLTVAVRLAKTRSGQLAAGDRIILFCRTIASARTLSGSSILDCPCYLSSLGPAERDATVCQWLEAERPFLVATTAFSTGIDVPSVVQIYHIGMPYGMIDFVQESGRGGRDGRLSHATILYGKNELLKLDKEIADAGDL